MWFLSRPHLDKLGELFYLRSCFVVKIEIPSVPAVKSSVKQCVHICFLAQCLTEVLLCYRKSDNRLLINNRFVHKSSCIPHMFISSGQLMLIPFKH